ncbi:MAG: EthD domain-containing protein [Burkholderiaceae bacterium]
MTIKMIYLAKRNPALAPEDFPQAWREHSALGAKCTNVRDKVVSVRQCSRVLAHPPLQGFSTEYDGVNLLTVKSLAAAHDIWSDPETLAVMRPDEPRVFSTYVRDFTLVCEETSVDEGAGAIRANPLGKCVVVGFLQGFGASASLSFPQARAVVRNRVCEAPPPGYAYDVILEAWFDDPVQATQALQGTSHAMLGEADCVWMLTTVTHCRP